MDKNMELPEGWKLLKLGQICTSPQYGYTTSGSKYGSLKLLRTTDITGGRIDWEKVPYCLNNPKDSEKYLLHDGDIVISRAGSVGVSYLINKPEPSVFASYLIRFKPINSIALSKYFYLFLKSPFYWKEITEKSLGIAVANVNATKLKEISVPIPPLKTQIQIIDKIEELFSELDKGIENLKTAQEQLKVYRQAVLKWAFEGRLTNENVKWQDVKLGQVANAIDPQPSHRTPPKVVNGIPYVSIREFDSNFDKIDFTNARIVSESVLEEHLNRYKLLIGDFVIGKIGTIGKPVRLVLPQNYALSANIVLIQPRKINPTYLYYFFQSTFIEKAFQSGKSATSQAAFGIQKVRELEIKLPSEKEQQEIVQEIESRLSVCDKIEETITTSIQQAEALRQSISRKAFEGKLLKFNKQPVEAKIVSIDNNDNRQRKVLAGHIIYAFQKGGYLGRTKLQKILYLCEQHAQLDFDTQYLKEAAGPLDSKFLYAFLNEAKQKNWIEETQVGNGGYKYEPSTSISELTTDYPKYFRSNSDKIGFVIKLLKDTDTDTAELIATIYAIWNNYIIEQKSLSTNLLPQEVYSWHEDKAKFKKPMILSTWQWMKDEKLIPTGFGEIITKGN